MFLEAFLVNIGKDLHFLTVYSFISFYFFYSLSSGHGYSQLVQAMQPTVQLGFPLTDF